MQLVLDDQLGRREVGFQLDGADLLVAVAEEALAAGEARDPAEELGDLALPGHGGELVHGGDQEAGEAAVDRLVHQVDRQVEVAGELAGVAEAGDVQLLGGVLTGVEAEAVGLEGSAAPGARLQRDRGAAVRLALLVGEDLGDDSAFLAGLAHEVGRAAGADPEADLERPGAQLPGVLPSHQLQGTDEGGGAGELVEGQQSEGVPHQDGHAGVGGDRAGGALAEAAVEQGEGGEAEVGLGLAAAGGEEQEFDGLAVGRVGDRPGPPGSAGRRRAGRAARRGARPPWGRGSWPGRRGGGPGGPWRRWRG